MSRKAVVQRKTNETNIKLEFELDGKGIYNIETKIGFFNHMLELFTKHGCFDLAIAANGDLNVDSHHTVEDVGIVLGEAIAKALGSKKSINRYGTEFVPMDEALVMVSVDLGGRAFLVFDAELTSPKLGEMETEMVEEFFRAVAFNANINLHIKCLYGKNTHHIIEAIFKAFARALNKASTTNENIDGVISTKGIL